jgi:thiol-disulfide isomerase/thioredoxin
MDIKKTLLNSVASSKFWMILFLVVVFVALVIYLYRTYMKQPEYIENDEFKDDGTLENEEVTVILFYTNWCPHCKKAKPVWNKFKADYDGREVNGKVLRFQDIDCEKEEEIANQYKISGYPTIKMVKKDEVVEYDAKPDYDTLRQFVEKMA